MTTLKQYSDNHKHNIAYFLYYEQHLKATDISTMTYEDFNNRFPQYNISGTGFIFSGIRAETGHISARQIENIVKLYEANESIYDLNMDIIGYDKTGNTVEQDMNLFLQEPDTYKFLELCGYKVNRGYKRKLTRKANGFTPTNKGYIYIYGITSDNHAFLKFGITNKSPESRHKQQMQSATREGLKYDSELLYQTQLLDGNDCLFIEKKIKLYIKQQGNNVPKSYFPDGYTETCEIDLLDNIINIIETHKTL